MSWGLVPSPDELCRTKRDAAEEKLGLASSMPKESTDLYRWAEDINVALIAAGDQVPKLKLAASLDIPQEHYWGATVRSKEATPRHRVIARFAREGLWEQIWSFNWDCLQENAFENVGLIRNGKDAGLPWPTKFRWFVTAADCAGLGEEHAVKIVKPHGCVMALVEAEDAQQRGDDEMAKSRAGRFFITSSELASLAPALGMEGTQQFIFASLTAQMCCRPVVIAGWRAGEEYLLKHFENTLPQALAQRELADDELSIIDLSFNEHGHSRIAAVYQRDRAQSHVPVEPSGMTTDKLCLWIQALYAVECLSRCAAEESKPALNDVASEIQQPSENDRDHFVIAWADSFLPSWVLLCWRYGFISCCSRHDNHAIQPEDIEIGTIG